jgi:hypothetical protein
MDSHRNPGDRQDGQENDRAPEWDADKYPPTDRGASDGEDVNKTQIGSVRIRQDAGQSVVRRLMAHRDADAARVPLPIAQ